MIDLKSIPVVQTGVKRKPQDRKLEALILHVATLIDPDAFSIDPGPSLAHARQAIAALQEEIDWLTVVPTDPAGEYARIVGERRQRDRLNPARQQSSAALRAERQKEALDRAKQVVDACRKLLPRANPRLFYIKRYHVAVRR